jgi:hypothetical protein
MPWWYSVSVQILALSFCCSCGRCGCWCWCWCCCCLLRLLLLLPRTHDAPFTESLHPRWNGGRPQRHLVLAVLGDVLQNVLHVLLETHLEHLVSFIQHDAVDLNQHTHVDVRHRLGKRIETGRERGAPDGNEMEGETGGQAGNEGMCGAPPARTHTRTHKRTQARTRAQTHARTHARTESRLRSPLWSRSMSRPGVPTTNSRPVVQQAMRQMRPVQRTR